jgi:hypothetical protein
MTSRDHDHGQFVIGARGRPLDISDRGNALVRLRLIGDNPVWFFDENEGQSIRSRANTASLMESIASVNTRVVATSNAITRIGSGLINRPPAAKERPRGDR